jgi:glycine betaine/proline transport system substrate-binding protein
MTASKTVMAAMAAFAFAMPATAFEPESTDTIKVMVADWTSMRVHSEILNVILSTYGYDVEQVIADDSARYPGFEAGDLHIALETWQTTQNALFNASVATGNVLDLGELGPRAREDWWYPIYVKELCPGLPNWEALRDCGAVFSAPDTAPNGRYLSGPVSWGGWDAERVQALGLPFTVVNSGTDAGLFAELDSAYKREAPIMLWIYEPHWAPSVYEGEFVEFPAYEDACYNDPSWGVNAEALYDCGKPQGWIKKMGWTGGEAKWPCAYEIVRNFTMDGPEVGALVYKVDVEGQTVEDVAMEWATANEAEWRGWAACAAD